MKKFGTLIFLKLGYHRTWLPLQVFPSLPSFFFFPYLFCDVFTELLPKFGFLCFTLLEVNLSLTLGSNLLLLTYTRSLHLKQTTLLLISITWKNMAENTLLLRKSKNKN